MFLKFKRSIYFINQLYITNIEFEIALLTLDKPAHRLFLLINAENILSFVLSRVHAKKMTKVVHHFH